MSRPRVHADNAAKMREWRKAKALVSYTVELPADCVEGLAQYMRFKDLTRTEVLTKLIRSQLLRKR